MGTVKSAFRSLLQGETAADRAAWLDTALRGAVGTAQNRYLQDMRSASRSFEAAETPAWAESWPTHAAPINEDLARQLPTLRARAAAQARNDEWAISYLTKLGDNVLGENGIRLQMRLTKPDGSLDKETNAILEKGWADWCAKADVSGLDWRQVERLALNALPQAGEFLVRWRPGAGPFNFQIQLLSAELLDVTLRRDFGGNRIRMGVEINDDGLAVAYWLRMSRAGDQPSDLITVGRHVRIPADQIIHRFRTHEIGQLRGYPWLSAGAQRLWMLHDFEQSAAVASSNAAKRQGFFVSPTGEAPPGFADTIVSTVLETAKAQGKVLSADEIQTLTSAAEKYSTTVPGQYDTLPHGYDFRPYQSDWPNITADGYIKQNLRGWSAARGMSYVTLGNDLEAVNYSSAQVGIVGEREHFKTDQKDLIDWLHTPVFARALPYIVLKTPSLKPSRLAEYLAAATWMPRRWQPIDPVKAENANEMRLKQRTTSRRRILIERGEDPDEIAAEIAEEEKLYGPYEGASGFAPDPTPGDGQDKKPPAGTDGADA